MEKEKTVTVTVFWNVGHKELVTAWGILLHFKMNNCHGNIRVVLGVGSQDHITRQADCHEPKFNMFTLFIKFQRS